MKTEAEIRKHIANLKVAQRMPCGCAGTEHASKCRTGALMMEVAIRNLGWVIGIEPDLDRQVEQMDKDVKEYKACQQS